MNVKKERFESLRLELQEFTPQEFVAACYQFNCIPISTHPYLTTEIAGNGDKVYPVETFDANHSHSTPHIATKINSVDPPPTNEGYVYETIHKKGYVTGRYQVVQYYQVGSKYHIGGWSLSTDPNHPNASA